MTAVSKEHTETKTCNNSPFSEEQGRWFPQRNVRVLTRRSPSKRILVTKYTLNVTTLKTGPKLSQVLLEAQSAEGMKCLLFSS